jgi:hypothetical protein
MNGRKYSYTCNYYSYSDNEQNGVAGYCMVDIAPLMLPKIEEVKTKDQVYLFVPIILLQFS